MALNKLNPFIRYARLSPATEACCSYRICYDCRLFWVQAGEGALTVGNEVIPLRAGTGVYLPPRSLYRFSLMSAVELRMFIINFDLVDDFSYIAESLRIATELTFDPKRSPAYPIPEEFSEPHYADKLPIGDSLTRIVKDYMNRTPYYQEASSARMKLVLLTLLENADNHERGPHADLVLRAKKYIQEHFSDPALNNTEIAAMVGYHPYYLNHLFLEETGLTMRQYLLDYRIRHACSRLSESEADVLTIAYDCGFRSSSYFIKRFRESVGVTPARYRAMGAEYF